MPILEGIQIQNYRALRDVTLGKTIYENKAAALPRLIAVIGANGVGKSSLLDALGFVGDCLSNGVEAACDRPHRGGFERLRTKGVTEPIRFEIRYREEKQSRPINYTLAIDVDGHGRPMVVEERLRQRRTGQASGQPRSFLHLTNGDGVVWAGESTDAGEGTRQVSVHMKDRQVLGISSLGTLEDHPRINKFRAFLSRWYLSYIDAESLRSQPMAGVDPHLSRRGENLSNYLQFVKRNNPEKFAEMLQKIATKIPGLQSITDVQAPDRRLLLEFTAQGIDEKLYQQDMSDGTLKMLAYMLLMQDPDPAPLIGIEEPENGLHHQLLAGLAQELRDFSKTPRGPQVLVATHSPYFVDALTPDAVWVLQKGADGYSQLKSAAAMSDVQALYDEGLPMGSLWYSNHFGAANP